MLSPIHSSFICNQSHKRNYAPSAAVTNKQHPKHFVPSYRGLSLEFAIHHTNKLCHQSVLLAAVAANSTKSILLVIDEIRIYSSLYNKDEPITSFILLNWMPFICCKLEWAGIAVGRPSSRDRQRRCKCKNEASVHSIVSVAGTEAIISSQIPSTFRVREN